MSDEEKLEAEIRELRQVRDRLTAQLDAVERVLAVHDWIEFDRIRAALRGWPVSPW